MNVFRFVPPLFLAACTSAVPHTSSLVSANAEVRPFCNVAVEAENPDSWRLVRADGFTFCLPGDWLPMGESSVAGLDPKTWRGSNGVIAWGAGEDQPLRQTIHVESVSREPGLSSQPIPQIETRRFREVIGGRMAEVGEDRVTGWSRARVLWPGEGIFLSGEANDEETSALLMVIFRTVRFVSFPSSV